MTILHSKKSLSYCFIAIFLSLTTHYIPLHAQESKPDSPQAEAPKIPVTVYKVAKINLETAEIFSGRIEAIDKVDIVARVQGFLDKRFFEEGRVVAKGDLLYTIEKDQYKNAVTQAEAALESAKAQELLAQQTYDRQKALTDRKVQSKAALDEATANLSNAKANILSAEASLELAKINLGYTDIYAPVSGKISRSNYSEGALVGPSSGTLATLVSVDPTYVSFPLPQKLLLEVQKQNLKKEDAIVELVLADNTLYEHGGTIAFEEVSATTSTDSVIVRASFPNPDMILIDQQLVDVKIKSAQENLKLAIPQAAMLLDQQGPYVLTVGANNTVSQTRIDIGAQANRFIEVTNGLSEETLVIIDNLQKLRPGASVAPNLAQDTRNTTGASQ